MANKDILIAWDFWKEKKKVSKWGKKKSRYVPGTQRVLSLPLCGRGINGIHIKAGGGWEER